MNEKEKKLVNQKDQNNQNDNESIDMDNSYSNKILNTNQSILEKLKPSSKNKMITKKFGNLIGPNSSNNNPNQSGMDFDIDNNNNLDQSIKNDFLFLQNQNKKNQNSQFNFFRQGSISNNFNNNNNNIESNYSNNFNNPNFLLNENHNNNNYKNLNLNDNKFEAMIQNTSELRNSSAYLHSNVNATLNNSTTIKWTNILRKSKEEALKLDLSQSEVLSQTNQLDFSAMSENIDDLNDIIEENYQMVITENSFLRQGYHSILPFLFLSSREIHRMCLSDYEIKMVNKSIKNKIKNNRLDWMDYFKKGLIKFYQAKYFESYFNFKAAFSMQKNDKEIAKWLAFNILIIIFCTNFENNEASNKFNFNDITNSFFNFNEKNTNSPNSTNFNSSHNFNIMQQNISNSNNNFFSTLYGTFKIDFSKMEKINIRNEDLDYLKNGQNENNKNSDEEENPLFACCNARKAKPKNFTVSSLINNYHPNEKEQYKHNKISLCIELEKILTELTEKYDKDTKDKDKENPKGNSNMNTSENNTDFKMLYYRIEIWWMWMMVSVYAKLRPEQKAFSKFYEPKQCVKKIKDKDVYLGYLAYAEYNSLINKSFNSESILVEIIYKYPKRIEAYLKLWNKLVKNTPKDYKKAHAISEVFWKNSSIIQFDNDVY